jgi:hypothetical protein
MSLAPEQRARRLIDAQLAAAGWILQDRDEINLGAELGVAVREYPMSAGPCDYLLFIDRRACGVVEAKPEGNTLSGFSDQASGYQHQLPTHLTNWGDPLRFDYEASGTEILFSDRADPEQRSRYVFAFHKPETLLEWLKEGTSLRARLNQLPPLVKEGLRDCQIEAITELESSLAQAKPRSLVQMTMGAGKTFTAATLSYRLLAHAGAHPLRRGEACGIVDTGLEGQCRQCPNTGHRHQMAANMVGACDRQQLAMQRRDLLTQAIPRPEHRLAQRFEDGVAGGAFANASGKARGRGYPHLQAIPAQQPGHVKPRTTRYSAGQAARTGALPLTSCDRLVGRIGACDSDCPGSVCYAQLSVEVLEMELHGIFRDLKVAGYFLVAQAFEQ